MNPIECIFQTKQTFVGFVTGGDGGINYCIDSCAALVEGGVDILEVGLPFSDPVADGPIIQRASKRSLEEGTTPALILEIAQGIRAHTDVPLILFTYFNPLLKKGDGYLKELQSAGFSAVLVVDLPPPLEGGPQPFFHSIKAAGLHPIFLASPSTDERRLSGIAEISEGFLYYACQKGTTGIREALPNDFAFHLSRIRQTVRLPVAAGFGIGDRKSAKAALEHADGFVVGSAFVKMMENCADPEELQRLARSIDPR